MRSTMVTKTSPKYLPTISQTGTSKASRRQQYMIPHKEYFENNFHPTQVVTKNFWFILMIRLKGQKKKCYSKERNPIFLQGSISNGYKVSNGEAKKR